MKQQLKAAGFEIAFDGAHFNEIVVKTDSPVKAYIQFSHTSHTCLFNTLKEKQPPLQFFSSSQVKFPTLSIPFGLLSSMPLII